MGRDITVTLEDGTQHVYKNAPDQVTPEQVTARAQQEFGQPVKALDGGRGGMAEAWRVVDKVIRGGALAMPRAAAELLQSAQAQAVEGGPLSYTPQGQLLKIRDKLIPKSVDDAIIKGMTPSEPETTAGKYIGAVGEGAVSAMTGGPLSQAKTAAAIGGAGGLGAETSAHLLGDNVLTRLLGGLVGGGTAAMVKSITPNAESLIRTHTQAMTPNDWRRAFRREVVLNGMGMPNIKSQLLGPNSSLDDVVEKASANQFVRPSLLKASRGVESAARRNLSIFADRELPVQVDPRRDFMAELQNTAKQREVDLLDQKNAKFAAALPHGIEHEIYPETYMQNLRKDLLTLSKNGAEGFGADTKQGRQLAAYVGEWLQTKGNGRSKNELANLYNELDAWGADAGINGRAVRKIKELLGSYTQEFQPARDAASAFFRSDVDPMRQGLAGDIAHARGGPDSSKYTAVDAVGRVFTPKIDQSLAIKKLGEDVGPSNVGKLLREHLFQSFDSVANKLSENPQVPARFADAVFGSEPMRRNVEAGLFEASRDAGTNPYALRNGFRKFIDAMSTYNDMKIARSVNGQSLDEKAGQSALATAFSAARRGYSWASDRATRKTYQQIADMVTSPDGLRKIEAIGRSKDPNYALNVLRSMVATSQPVDNPGGLQPSNTGE